jgi:hypothetical protein
MSDGCAANLEGAQARSWLGRRRRPVVLPTTSYRLTAIWISFRNFTGCPLNVAG